MQQNKEKISIIPVFLKNGIISVIVVMMKTGTSKFRISV